MYATLTKSKLSSFIPVATLLAILMPPLQAADDNCQDSGDYAFICGPVSAEDLVLVPDTKWIIASGFGGAAALYLIDSGQKTWHSIYPTDELRARHNMTVYGTCPGSPDPNNFVAHGLSIQPGADGHSTLYVVGHGEREAIEVFDVDATGKVPVLTWTGCVVTPDSLAPNSVASLADGSLLATIPLFAGMTITDSLFGKTTGAVFRWSPGDAGFTKVEGTEMPYANGIEASADGKEFYVASSGLRQVLAFSNTNPGRLLRSSEELSVIPDNLHMGSGNTLITAGLEVVDEVCGNILEATEFDLGAFASCPRPFTVFGINPQTMATKVLARSPAQQHFSNVTMALEVGSELWIGTFAGDRIAYRKRKP
jgi:hypothetical protein